MTRYEKLLMRAEKLGIKIKEIDLGVDDECGYYCNNKILINNSLNEKQKHAVLVEELGHYHKTVGDITDQSKVENRKQELIARRWGYERTVSLVGLIEAFEYGARNPFETSEFLGVTEKYLHDCIESYKRKYGLMHQIEQYILYFEPTFYIGKSFNQF